MLRYTTDRARPGLVALYDIRPGNGAGQFLQPRSPHGAVSWPAPRNRCGRKGEGPVSMRTSRYCNYYLIHIYTSLCQAQKYDEWHQWMWTTLSAKSTCSYWREKTSSIRTNEPQCEESATAVFKKLNSYTKAQPKAFNWRMPNAVLH